MDPRRASRTVIDPKIRQVGFFAPPDRSQSGPPGITSSSSPPLLSDLSPSANSLSPVMIPPPLPRHLSDIPQVPLSPLRRPSNESIPAGSYNPSEFASESVAKGSNSGKVVASSLPSGFDMSVAKHKSFPPSSLTTVSMINMPPNLTGKNSL